MSPIIRGLFTLCCLGGFAGIAPAAILGTFSFAVQHALPVAFGLEPSTAVTVHFAYSVAPGSLEDDTTAVFEDFSLIDSDDLRGFELHSAIEDPELPGFLALATNGQDDDIRVNVIGNRGGGSGKVAPESVLLMPILSPGPDFAGSTVTGLELFISSIEINPSASFGEINWTINGELRFIGTAPRPIPLPSGLILFASGWPMLTAWSRPPK